MNDPRSRQPCCTCVERVADGVQGILTVFYNDNDFTEAQFVGFDGSYSNAIRDNVLGNDVETTVKGFIDLFHS